jgi:hypothetical protein
VNDHSQLLLRSIRGPVIVITIGVLCAADRFTDYHFHQTWPVLLIVIGLLQLIGGRRRRGGYYQPPAGPAGYTSSPAASPPAKSQEPRS